MPTNNAWNSEVPVQVSLGGTGIATTTAYAPIIGGTTATGAFQSASTGLASAGYGLVSNGNAAPPSLQAMANSAQGTANQVLVNGTSGSAQTGALTLTTPQDIGTGSTVRFAKLGLGVAASNNQLSINGNASVGFSDTAAPTNGLIVSGATGVGASSFLGFFSAAGVNVADYDSQVAINGSVAGNDAQLSNRYALYSSCTLKPAYQGTVPNCFFHSLGGVMAPAAGCTVTNCYTVSIGAGSASGAGTTTNAYSLRVANPAYGSNQYTAYFDTGVGVGASPVATSALSVTSTTLGFLPPRMTTNQKNAISTPAEGLVVYDLTLHKLCVYTGAAWQTITSA